MEVYRTKNGHVAKYVHDDGSETAIKTLPEGEESCGGTSRKKVNIFISFSSGCEIKCGFCFLTSKGFPYHPLTTYEISKNVIAAIKAELTYRPELSELPLNLSWMGMGDAWLNLTKVQETTCRILDELSPMFTSIEGVDIATTLPCIKYDDFWNLQKIQDTLKATGKLTAKPKDRTDVRVFYSLHSMKDDVRRVLIPKTLDTSVALVYLDTMADHYNVIYHCMFLNGCNDTYNDIALLLQLFQESDTNKQLRILRYNQCDKSRYIESLMFDKIIERLYKHIPKKLKVQASPGSEISAACGQFLMSRLLNK